jgi:hypothetical protein
MWLGYRFGEEISCGSRELQGIVLPLRQAVKMKGSETGNISGTSPARRNVAALGALRVRTLPSEGQTCSAVRCPESPDDAHCQW